MKTKEAFEELKIVQDIISTQEELCFKIFGWAVGLVTALTIGFFHEKIELNVYAYIFSGLIIILGFFIFARYHWNTFYHAIERSKEIEKEINSGCYSEVGINSSLENTPELSLFEAPRFYLPYGILALIVITSGLSHFLSWST